jgi:hypothetical protein
MRRLAILVLLIAGCGEDRPEVREPARTVEPPPDRPAERRGAARPEPPRCPRAAANCAAASGRVIALEAVDPDGDGDLHVIVAGGSTTLPGVTVLDVSRDLRPRRDPRVGDWAAGAGPVYTGSHGQRQIQVERVVFARR